MGRDKRALDYHCSVFKHPVQGPLPYSPSLLQTAFQQESDTEYLQRVGMNGFLGVCLFVFSRAELNTDILSQAAQGSG